MKIAIIALIALTAQNSLANCLGEAQIIAKVEAITQKSLTSCVVSISADSIQQYNESMVCRLDLNEVLEKGVQVGLKDGHDCSFEEGQDISGVLVKNSAGDIYLE